MENTTKALIQQVEDALFLVSEIAMKDINAVTTDQLMKQKTGDTALKKLAEILEKNNL
jgi:hypothetical protein